MARIETYSALGRMYKSLSVTNAIAFPVGDHVAYAVLEGMVGGIIGRVLFSAILWT